MSKVTPPGPAGAESETVKRKAVVPPPLPSFCDTSLMESVTPPPPAPCGVTEKSSMARPSSAPEELRSFQRIQKVAPLAMFRLEMVVEMAVRLAALFPSSAPAAAAVLIGFVKSSAFTSVYVPTHGPESARRGWWRWC